MKWLHHAHSAIESCLAKYGSRVVREGAARWRFTVENGAPVRATAHLEDDLLLLAASPGSAVERATVPRLLEWNAGLPGNSKFALDRREIVVRSEVVADDDISLATVERLAGELGGIRQALELLHGGNSREAASARTQVESEEAEAASGGLSGVLSEAGWKCTERAAGTLAVDLESSLGFYQARVEAHTGGWRARVELERLGDGGETPRLALSILLLSGGNFVRLVRPVCWGAPDGWRAGFEAWVNIAPSVEEAGHAMTALSLACSHCGREAKVFKDEAVAAGYLAARGFTDQSD